jgi:hypothetical protein
MDELEGQIQGQANLFQGYPEMVEISPSSELADEVRAELFALINSAYGEVGGHMNVSSPGALDNYEYWFFNNPSMDKDGKIRSAAFASTTRNGSVKVSVFASDGSPAGKGFMMKFIKDILSRKNWWAELPDQAAAFFISRGVPVVSDQEAVLMLLGRRVFNSNFDWHGHHPTKKNFPGEGWYSKDYAGNQSVRTILGSVGSDHIQKIKDFVSKSF